MEFTVSPRNAIEIDAFVKQPDVDFIKVENRSEGQPQEPAHILSPCVMTDHHARDVSLKGNHTAVKTIPEHEVVSGHRLQPLLDVEEHANMIRCPVSELAVAGSRLQETRDFAQWLSSATFCQLDFCLFTLRDKVGVPEHSGAVDFLNEASHSAGIE